MIRQPLQRGVGIDHIWRLRRPPAGNIGINEFAVGQGLRRRTSMAGELSIPTIVANGRGA